MERIRHLLLLLGLCALSACGGLSKTETPEKEADGVTFDGALASPLLKAETSSEVVARIRVESRPPPDTGRAPVNVALVVDTSGSMEGKAIEDARKACLALIGGLKEGDRLALVVFHSKHEVLFPSTELDGSARRKAEEMVAKMRASGTTDLEGGLRAGLGEVRSHFQPQGINRIVLVGDGVPNNDRALRDLAKASGAQGVTITAMGLGQDYDETLMGALAQLSGGTFRYIDDSSKVASFLREEVLRLDAAHVKNARIRLSPGPGVRITEVVGRPSSTVGDGVMVALGDLTKNEPRDVFVRMTVAGRRKDASVELLDAVMEFDSAGGVHFERRAFLGAHSTESDAKIEAAKNRGIEDGAALAEASAVTLRAIEFARAGNAANARSLLEQGANAAETAGKKTSNAKLLDQAKTMRALMSDLPKPVASVAPAPAAQLGVSNAQGVVAKSAPPAPSSPQMLRAHNESMTRLR